MNKNKSIEEKIRTKSDVFRDVLAFVPKNSRYYYQAIYDEAPHAAENDSVEIQEISDSPLRNIFE